MRGLSAPAPARSYRLAGGRAEVWDGTAWNPLAWLYDTGVGQAFDPRAYGLIGDGTSHPLSETYATLAAAQAVFPFATALSQEIDYAAAQRAINDAIAAKGRVELPAGEIELGADGLLVDGSTIDIHGAGYRNTVLNYAGSGAAVAFNSGAGVATTGFSAGDFRIQCADVGAYGVSLGAPSAAPVAALGMFENILASGAATAGWRLRAAQECLFINCSGEDGAIGMLIEYDGATAANTTDSLWIGGRFRNNAAEGVQHTQGVGMRFVGTTVESNGKEGYSLVAPGDGTASNNLLSLVDCWFEQNNKGRTGGPFYQVSLVTTGSSIPQKVVIERCNLSVPNPNNAVGNPAADTDNGHIYIDKCQVALIGNYYNGTQVGGLVTKPIATSASSSNHITFRGTTDPSTLFALGGANVKLVAHVEDTGAYSLWVNVAGTPTKRLEVSNAGAIGFFNATPAAQPALSGDAGLATGAAAIAAALATLGLASGSLTNLGGALNTLQSPTVVEDFVGGTNTSGAIGTLGWNISQVSGSGGTVTAVESAAGHFGEITVGSGTTAGGCVVAIHPRISASLGIVDFSTTWLPEVWFLAKPTQTDTDTQCRLGWSDDPSSATPGYAAYFEKLPADTNWWAVTRAASTETRTDTGVAVAVGYAVFRIKKLANGNVQFDIGTLAQFVAGTGYTTVTNTTNTPGGGSTGQMLPFASAGNNATTTNKTLRLDTCVMAFGGNLART